MTTAPKPMPERVAQQIEAMILDGRLKAGDRLPAERSLCASLKVSRNTLRESLKELRARGVIETRGGSGTYVAFFQEFHPSTPLQKLLTNHAETLQSLLEVRELLEGEAAALAAQRATKTDTKQLKQAYEAVAAEYSDADASAVHAERDLAFHRAIYAAAHSPVLLLALNGIRDLLMNFIYDTSGKLFASPNMRRQLNTQHRRIYRAIEQGDAGAARRAAKTHIRAVAERLEELNT